MPSALVAALLLAAAPEDAVRAADVALDRAAAAGDAAAFGALVDDAAAFASARRISRGRAEVLESWRPMLTPGGPRLRWAPARAEVAASGDLAFTTGRFTFEVAGKDGKVTRSEGAYVTVWRRGAGGTWRALLDAALEPASKLGEGLARTPLQSATSTAGDLEATIGKWTRGVESGFWLAIRRRAADGRWGVVVDSALPFAPGPP